MSDEQSQEQPVIVEDYPGPLTDLPPGTDPAATRVSVPQSKVEPDAAGRAAPAQSPIPTLPLVLVAISLLCALLSFMAALPCSSANLTCSAPTFWQQLVQALTVPGLLIALRVVLVRRLHPLAAIPSILVGAGIGFALVANLLLTFLWISSLAPSSYHP